MPDEEALVDSAAVLDASLAAVEAAPLASVPEEEELDPDAELVGTTTSVVPLAAAEVDSELVASVPLAAAVESVLAASVPVLAALVGSTTKVVPLADPLDAAEDEASEPVVGTTTSVVPEAPEDSAAVEVACNKGNRGKKISA